MSAYVVSREHIVYLVDAALRLDPGSSYFSWYHNNQRRELCAGDLDRHVQVAQMLWDENVRSVEHRYPDSRHNRDFMPGPHGDLEIRPQDFPVFTPAPDPLQVLKSCECYEYQSCEHDEWESSEAHSFIEKLRRFAITELKGYDKAQWGPPAKLAKVA